MLRAGSPDRTHWQRHHRSSLPQALLSGQQQPLSAAEQGKPAAEIEKFGAMFSEVQRAVDSKQLHSMIRTQYMRTAFQIPFDATVRVSLDTNLTMIKENPDSGPSCAEAGRCGPKLSELLQCPEQDWAV